MQWTVHRPFVPAALLDRLDRRRLRRHARRYAAHGWPVRIAESDPRRLLLSTGEAFDAVEAPAALGLRVLGAARLLGPSLDALGPVAVTATGRWTFLVRPGTPLRTELDNRLDIVRHGRGSWITAPPSRLPEGPVRWAVPPERAQWRLPDPEAVQSLLADALGTVRVPPMTVPRQLSTARRGG